jgi:UDP-GlcNAc:undecaprenyl-phosphate GlcNAc-1-phosphate transferase
MTGILTGGPLIYILGRVDALKGMPAKVKFLGQIAIACVVFAFGIRINFMTSFFSMDSGYTFFSGMTAFLLTVIWIAGITNTINLIDGLDGLAAGVAMIASFSIAYAAYISSGQAEPSVAALSMLALAGGALGFLPYNFNPAKIFMGDSGSLFLGFMLAVLSIEGATKSATVVATIAPVLVLGVPIFDTAFAILRRLVNKRPIMEADKGHLHHRIMAAGFGQRRAVLMLYGISGAMGVAAVLLSRDLFVESFALLVIAGMLIYVFLTDASSMKLKLKAVNIAQEERKRK